METCVIKINGNKWYEIKADPYDSVLICAKDKNGQIVGNISLHMVYPVYMFKENFGFLRTAIIKTKETTEKIVIREDKKLVKQEEKEGGFDLFCLIDNPNFD